VPGRHARRRTGKARSGFRRVQATSFAELELIACDTAGLVFEVAAADGAVLLLGGYQHLRAGLTRGRTDNRIDADQHHRGLLTAQSAQNS
jgi:hypothetical protein